jgi:hypothetical protein
MGYHASSGPISGPIMWRDRQAAVGVLEFPGDHTPIGVALEAGWDHAGRSLWRLIVHGDDVPGSWIVVGREFWPEG